MAAGAGLSTDLGAAGEDGGAEDSGPGAIIAEFKARRLEKQRRGIFFVLLVSLALNAAGIGWATLMHGEYWALGYGIGVAGNCMVMIMPFDWNEEYGSMSMNRPSLALALFIYTQISMSNTFISIGTKYGLPIAIRWGFQLYTFGSAAASAVENSGLSGSPFRTIAEVKDLTAPAWRRRGCITEAMGIDGHLCLSMYTLVAFLMWVDGQYDNGPLGHAGGLLQVAIQIAIQWHWHVTYWHMFKGAAPATWLGRETSPTGPGGGLYGTLFFTLEYRLAVIFCMYGIFGDGQLQYYTEPGPALRDFELNMTHFGDEGTAGTDANHMYLLAAAFIIPPGFIGFYRDSIYLWLSRPFESKQRLIDGAFIAALLDDDNSAATADGVAPTSQQAGNAGEQAPAPARKRDLISESAALIRRVDMRHITLGLLGSSPRDVNGSIETVYQLSESCGLGGIDYFVSHSWGDDAEQKYAQMCAVSLEFILKHGRAPTFWLDKVCIDQSEIERDLRCLPVFVQSCSQLLILCGDSYATRLWCVLELYIHFAMSGAAAAKRTKIANCRTAEQADDVAAAGAGEGAAAEGGRGANALTTFDVKDAHCYSAADEAKLRRVIESESADSFNQAIREAGASLLEEAASAPASRPGVTLRASAAASSSRAAVDNPLAEGGGGGGGEEGDDAGAALRRQFEALDESHDGRLCRADLVRAFGGVLAEEQVDDLLGVIATGTELRVNGTLSIGLPEFQAWMRRSR